MLNDNLWSALEHKTDVSYDEIFSKKKLSFSNQRPENETDSPCMLKRMYKIKRVCNAHPEWKLNDLQGNAYVFNGSPVQVAYCEVPKVGCTFWKRVLRYLNKDYENLNVTNPNELTRLYTHMKPFKKTIKLTLTDQEDFQLFQEISNKFTFTRDPYSRQWSAYLDKFFLPDFWNSFGKTASMMFRRRPTCGHDVSFEEYLRYIIGWIGTNASGSVKNRTNPAGAVKTMSVDRHFLPVSDVCNPCKVNYAFIGHQETFVSDSRQIMEEFGTFSTVGEFVFSNVIENEITTLSEYYLDLSEQRSQLDPGCYSKTLVCRRLWKVFQINGYIGNELDFPESQVSCSMDWKSCKESFISTVLRSRDNGSANHSVWMSQRRQSLINAYKELPRKLLESFQETYAKDFELFGYDNRPEDIFIVRLD